MAEHRRADHGRMGSRRSPFDDQAGGWASGPRGGTASVDPLAGPAPRARRRSCVGRLVPVVQPAPDPGLARIAIGLATGLATLAGIGSARAGSVAGAVATVSAAMTTAASIGSPAAMPAPAVPPAERQPEQGEQQEYEEEEAEEVEQAEAEIPSRRHRPPDGRRLQRPKRRPNRRRWRRARSGPGFRGPPGSSRRTASGDLPGQHRGREPGWIAGRWDQPGVLMWSDCGDATEECRATQARPSPADEADRARFHHWRAYGSSGPRSSSPIPESATS